MLLLLLFVVCCWCRSCHADVVVAVECCRSLLRCLALSLLSMLLSVLAWLLYLSLIVVVHCLVGAGNAVGIAFVVAVAAVVGVVSVVGVPLSSSLSLLIFDVRQCLFCCCRCL